MDLCGTRGVNYRDLVSLEAAKNLRTITNSEANITFRIMIVFHAVVSNKIAEKITLTFGIGLHHKQVVPKLLFLGARHLFATRFQCSNKTFTFRKLCQLGYF